MGNSLIIFGRIEGVLHLPPKFTNRALLRQQNEEIISGLGSVDEGKWPPLHREMFSCPPDKNFSAFDSQVIHLGASFKTTSWDHFELVWIEKFEGLLRRLFWQSAIAVFEHNYYAPQKLYKWTPTSEALRAMYEVPHEPVKEWSRNVHHLLGEEIR
jgi:hypothetical protein